MLKPQDILLALKLLSPEKNTQSYSALARSVGLSKTEVAKSLERLVESRLIRSGTLVPYRSAISNVLIKGVPYFMPAPSGDAEGQEMAVFGVATGQQVALLPQLNTETVPVVWPAENGQDSGYALTPICPEAPEAARQDPFVYRLLALTDLVRSHRSSLRERSVAAQAIENQVLGTDVLKERVPVVM